MIERRSFVQMFSAVRMTRTKYILLGFPSCLYTHLLSPVFYSALTAEMCDLAAETRHIMRRFRIAFLERLGPLLSRRAMKSRLR